MMCKKHNRFVRAGTCDLCLKDKAEARELQIEIDELERENRQINLVLWPN